jgi:phage/plasmid-like protein (TIGR03299 family)
MKMGEYNGVVGGVSSMVSTFNPWWKNMPNTIAFDQFDDDGSLTPRVAYERALNWRVELRDIYIPITTDGPYGVSQIDWKLVEGKKATVKTDDDTVLGVVSENYGVTQNIVLCEFAEALKTYGDVQVTSAGSLFDFKQVWMLAKLGADRHFADNGDETIQQYLMIATGHDGTLALSARPTNVRVECMNTFAWAMRDKSIVTLRHTANVDDRLAAARQVITEAYNHQDQMDEEIRRLLDTSYGRRQYVDYLVPTLAGERPDSEGRALSMWERRRDGLVAAYERPDQQNIVGTAWGAVMAVNSYENWSAQLRGTDRATYQARKALRDDFPLTQQARQLVLA